MQINVRNPDGTTTPLDPHDPRAELALRSAANMKSLLVSLYLRNLFLLLAVLSGVLGAIFHADFLIPTVVFFGACALNAGMRYQIARHRLSEYTVEWQAVNKH